MKLSELHLIAASAQARNNLKDRLRALESARNSNYETVRDEAVYRGTELYAAVNAYNTASVKPTARMRGGATTDDYRNATKGEGGFGSLGYEWDDKPHRLIFDLCGEIDALREYLEWKPIADAPKDRHILIGADGWACEGWWARDERRFFEGGRPKEGWAIEYNAEFGEHIFVDGATHYLPLPQKPMKGD